MPLTSMFLFCVTVIGFGLRFWFWDWLEQAIPLVSLFVLVGREGAKSASLIAFFIPFIALAIGVIFLDEAFSIKVFVGLIIVLSGAFWIAKTS